MPKVTKLPKWAIKQAGGIGKKAWALARRGRKSSSPRRSTVKRRGNPNGGRRMRRMAIPHPSVTGLASGAIIANFINQGPTTGRSVIDALQASNLETAANRLMVYSTKLVTTSEGRKQLIAASAIAIIGTGIKRAVPGVKLGTKKLHFTL